MGHLKDIANQPKLQSFPNSTFEIVGDVPASQCSEAKLESILGFTVGPPVNDLTVTPGFFAGHNLIGKKCTIIVSPTGFPGTFDIIGNDDTFVQLGQNPGTSTNVEFFIHNGGSLILTRDVPSFAAFIDAAGYAYTIKGAKLYTNIPPAQLQPACSIRFNPLT